MRAEKMVPNVLYPQAKLKTPQESELQNYKIQKDFHSLLNTLENFEKNIKRNMPSHLNVTYLNSLELE